MSSALSNRISITKRAVVQEHNRPFYRCVTAGAQSFESKKQAAPANIWQIIKETMQ